MLNVLEAPNHPSRPRNPLISQIFYDIGYIERYGSGITRMTDACHAAGLDAPQFELIGGGLRLIFKAKEAIPQDKHTVGALNGAVKLSVYKYIQQKPGIQRKDLIAMLEESSRTLDRALKELLERNLIERRGSKKTGGYFPV